MGILQRAQQRFDTVRKFVDLESYGERIELMARRVDSIMNAWTGLGGNADKGRGGAVNFSDPLLTIEQLRWLTRKNQYAQRYVTIFPDYALRKGWRVADESDEQQPTKEFDKALNVRRVAFKGSVAARKFGGCPVVVVTNNPNVSEPWGPADTEILNLVPLDPEEAIPTRWFSGMGDKRFREVSHWTINPRIGSLSTSQNDFHIQAGEWHADRVIYIPGQELSDYERLSNFVHYGYDDSVLQTAWDAIRARTSDDQALSTLTQELSVTVMKIEGLASLSLTDQEELIDMRARAIGRDMSNNQPVLMGDGESIQTLAANVSGAEHLSSNSRLTLSSAAGVPLTIFYGDTPAGFNTDNESGQNMFFAAVEAFRELKIGDPFLNRLYELAALTGQVALQGEWAVEWPPLDVPSEETQATTRKAHAETDAIRITSGVVTPEHVAKSRFGGAEYGEELDPLTPEELAQIEADADEAAMEAAVLEAEAMALEQARAPEPEPFEAAAE